MQVVPFYDLLVNYQIREWAATCQEYQEYICIRSTVCTGIYQDV